MNTEQERADFEAWCKERFGQIPLWVEEDGEYLLSSVQLRFEAYQAGRAALQSQDRETASAIRGDSYAGIYVWYGEANCSQKIAESTAKAARDERGLFNSVAVGAIDALMDHALGKAIDHARRIEGET